MNIVLFLALLVLGVVAHLRASVEALDGAPATAAFAHANQTNAVPLSAIAGHPVSRVCLVPEYQCSKQAVEEFGLQEVSVPDFCVAENRWGLLMMDASKSTIREFSTAELDPDYYFGPPRRDCIEGANLRLQFSTIAPELSGGQLVADGEAGSL